MTALRGLAWLRLLLPVLQVNADAGAYADLRLGQQALLVALWMPLL